MLSKFNEAITSVVSDAVNQSKTDADVFTSSTVDVSSTSSPGGDDTNPSEIALHITKSSVTSDSLMHGIMLAIDDLKEEDSKSMLKQIVSYLKEKVPSFTNNAQVQDVVTEPAVTEGNGNEDTEDDAQKHIDEDQTAEPLKQSATTEYHVEDDGKDEAQTVEPLEQSTTTEDHVEDNTETESHYQGKVDAEPEANDVTESDLDSESMAELFEEVLSKFKNEVQPKSSSAAQPNRQEEPEQSNNIFEWTGL
eukprot:75193_1